MTQYGKYELELDVFAAQALKPSEAGETTVAVYGSMAKKSAV
jgi:hypothetical protein